MPSVSPTLLSTSSLADWNISKHLWLGLKNPKLVLCKGKDLKSWNALFSDLGGNIEVTSTVTKLTNLCCQTMPWDHGQHQLAHSPQHICRFSSNLSVQSHQNKRPTDSLNARKINGLEPSIIANVWSLECGSKLNCLVLHVSWDASSFYNEVRVRNYYSSSVNFLALLTEL